MTFFLCNNLVKYGILNAREVFHMKKKISMITALFLSVMALTSCSDKKTVLDPENPVNISVWHYYNGVQQESFNALIEKFNQSKGKELGIVVEASNHGSVIELEENVFSALEKDEKSGPNIFAAYADTAYKIHKKDKLVDLNAYLNETEIKTFVNSYIEEGNFDSNGSLKIFPIAKSTEVLMLNESDWQAFAVATNTTIKDLETVEGISTVAQKYYEYTDALTPEPNDGKAFFGRDALANYFVIGMKEHGKDIFEVNNEGKVTLHFDKNVIRKLWDHYYIPYVKGYFSSSGRFRSDDIKSGDILSFIGSSSGATFFPDFVVDEEGKQHNITMKALPAPHFEGKKKYAVQQGAGMVVMKSNEKNELASIEFLKWFTEKEQNIKFSIESGYLPVKIEANHKTNIDRNAEISNSKVEQVLDVAISDVNTYDMYTAKAFDKATKARNILEYALNDKAKADRVAVEKALADGNDYESALISYLSDENFNQWYTNTKGQLEQLIQ